MQSKTSQGGHDSVSTLHSVLSVVEINEIEPALCWWWPQSLTKVSIIGPQYLQDLDDEEVAEMTKKKQRECEVDMVIF